MPAGTLARHVTELLPATVEKIATQSATRALRDLIPLSPASRCRKLVPGPRGNERAFLASHSLDRKPKIALAAFRVADLELH